MNTCFVIDYTVFYNAISVLWTKFPFVFVTWLYDFFSGLISVAPALPDVSLSLFFFTIDPLGWLVDYSSIIDPVMSFVRWLLTGVFVVGFLKGYLSRWM